VFSGCGQWRYLLWRFAVPRGRVLAMGLLNPSKADDARDDATIARCRALARRQGGGNLLVWNLFALCATDPAELRRAGDPVGCDNDSAIALAFELASETILAWGNHGGLLGRDAEVLAPCAASGVPVRILGLTGQGRPRHPLYLPRTAVPCRWRIPTSPAPSSR
jgi:hypothetical protein